MTNVEQILKEFGENVTRNAKQNLGASYWASHFVGYVYH